MTAVKKLAVPPGRAGRLWLERRLRVARRGADLLDRKLRILQAELEQRRDAAELTRQEWERCCGEAERLLLRAELLGGQRAIRLAADAGVADVRISYAVTTGVRHPVAGSCTTPEPVTWAGFDVAQARRAHGAALDAAAAHAAASAALRVIDAETAVTRYRLRAVRDRWIPRLEQARTDVIFALEELERADNARLSRAAGRNNSRTRS
ncbi:MAG: V-type ATP synthase subunit D [Streptosporangiaceae bacterium]